MNRQPTEREKTFARYSLTEGLIPEYIKNSTN
jgi:hypothetical protein